MKHLKLWHRWMPAVALSALALTACEQAADLTAARAQVRLALQRQDSVHSLVAHGSTVLAGAQDGVLLRSGDGGQQWTRVELPGAAVIALDRCADGTWLALDFYHRVWSADAPATQWQPHAVQEPANPVALHCDPAGRWWVAGSRATLAVSADHGASWTVSNLRQDTQITTLQFVDAQHGFALGEFGLVLATSDAGTTWTVQPKIAGDYYPYAAFFSSRTEGVVSGLAGVMLATHDGGRTWQREPNETGVPLYRLFAHRQDVWAAGANGTLARHGNGAWQAVTHGDATPAPLFAAASTGTAVVVGGPGGLLHVARLAAQ